MSQPLRFVLSSGCEFSHTYYYALPDGRLLSITDHRSCDMPRDVAIVDGEKAAKLLEAEKLLR